MTQRYIREGWKIINITLSMALRHDKMCKGNSESLALLLAINQKVDMLNKLQAPDIESNRLNALLAYGDTDGLKKLWDINNLLDFKYKENVGEVIRPVNITIKAKHNPKEYAKNWYILNKAHRKEYFRSHYQDNKWIYKIKHQDYYEKNQKAIRKYQNNYSAKKRVEKAQAAKSDITA